MPIEIREIVIKATVNQGDASGGAAQASPAASNGSGGQDAVQESVEQVFQIIEDKKER